MVSFSNADSSSSSVTSFSMLPAFLYSLSAPLLHLPAYLRSSLYLWRILT